MFKLLVGGSLVLAAVLLSPPQSVDPSKMQGAGCDGETGSTSCIGSPSCNGACASFTTIIEEGHVGSANPGTSEECSGCNDGNGPCATTTFTPAVAGC